MTDTATEPEAVTGELVQRDAPEAAVEVPAAVSTAIDRAAEAALAMPGVPGRDEFLSLAAQAKMLSLSGAAPEAVRNNPHVAFHVAMVGRDLGISPTAALNLIDVIKTRGGYQLSLSPQLLNAQITRLGLGSVRPIVQERDRCVAGAFAPDGTQLGETEFTWSDAIDAGLVGPECKPGVHVKNREGKCPCNQGYRTYPRRMMWWRAAGFCANDWFPSASVGLYSPEELGAVVGEDGRPLDPAQVALPPGYSDPIQEQAQRQAAQDAPASGAELWALQESIYSLPPAQQEALRENWKGNERLKAYGLRNLPKRLLATARAMANAQWATARREGADQQTGVAVLRERLARLIGSLTWLGPVDPTDPPASAAGDVQEPPEGPSGSDTPAEPATGHTAPDGLPAEPEFDVDPEAVDRGPEPDPDGNVEPERDWRPVMREIAQAVMDLTGELPEGIGQRIGEAVGNMHHTTINRVIDEAGEAESYPPSSPIGLRRMVATFLLCTAFQTTGELPAVVEQAEV